MAKLYYVAYGSNLHPLRLMERVPSAKFVDVVELPRSVVNFHKRSVDGSGKCNLVEEESATSYGALYEFFVVDRVALNRAEGFGKGYRAALLQFSIRGVQYNPYVYVAESNYIDHSLRPYDWYKEMTVLGASHHGFPGAYIDSLRGALSIPDPIESRAAEGNLLLEKMRVFQAG